MTDYEKFIWEQARKCRESSGFDKSLYERHHVKLGLRDRDGKGVVAGLTNISRVTGYTTVDGHTVPCKGRLTYRGYPIDDLIKAQGSEKGLFEKCAYLLLFNELPDDDQLSEFRVYLNRQMTLPSYFVKEVILRENGNDVMNTMSRCVMNLAMYDRDVSDMSVEKALKNCINIIGSMPLFAVYGYQAYAHYDMGESLLIVNPDPKLTVAENILRMLNPQHQYTDLEAMVLDRLLVLHMEHGGGNNSTFTARVVTSTGSDTYSVIVAALMSLKGPRHGGANLKVSAMTQNIRENVSDITDPEEMKSYLRRIVNRDAFDKSGLVYGMGHAVYTLSDPRAEILRSLAEKLAEADGRSDEFRMYRLIEELSPDLIRERHDAGPVCANVDLYSGFVYELLGIPSDLYTPMFAMARTVGWCAHHLEEISSSNKIIRPAYVSVTENKDL